MRKMVLSRISITTHCHATEDAERVKQAVFNILPPNMRNRASIEQEVLHGYHGNPITKFKVVLEEDDALELLKYLLRTIGETDRHLLINTIDMRYNRKSNELYVRLSKQDAYMGSLTIYDGDDAIRISIAFSMEKSVEAARNFLENLIKESIEDAQI